MAISMADIKKLRELTSAGLTDCKKALEEANGDMKAAVEVLRKKGQAVAAKRADRSAAEGCVLAKANGEYAAIVALNCETDFVAKNEGFVALTQQILDLAMANKPKNVDELKAIAVDGRTIADLVVEKGGQTGEKTEIGAFECIEAASTAAYTHFSKKLATIVGFNQPDVPAEVGNDVAMQVASMNPVAVDRASVPQSVIDSEYAIALDKTKAEQIQKAVEAALNKAKIVPLYYTETEEHLNEAVMKGFITEEQAQQVRDIKEKTAAEKANNLNETMIKNIANGRMNKFYKDSTLMEQEFIKDGNMTIAQYLDKTSKGLVAVGFKRVNLNAD